MNQAIGVSAWCIFVYVRTHNKCIYELMNGYLYTVSFCVYMHTHAHAYTYRRRTYAAYIKGRSVNTERKNRKK